MPLLHTPRWYGQLGTNHKLHPHRLCPPPPPGAATPHHLLLQAASCAPCSAPPAIPSLERRSMRTWEQWQYWRRLAMTSHALCSMQQLRAPRCDLPG